VNHPAGSADRLLGSDGSRAVLHIDMDAFYVSVELRTRPELRGKPVVVGGTGARGVIAAASYEARRYGVHSALSSVVARRRCPHAVFLPGDHELYGKVSAQVHEVFESFTPLVEPIALDEAFLDVTGALRSIGSAHEIAQLIRTRIRDELELECCVGGGASKFIAKLASKQAKPRIIDMRVVPGPGVVLVGPGAELQFLHPLPVQALWGVGPATLERLDKLRVRTIGDLAQIGQQQLESALGRAHGRHLHDLAWAIDDRPVVSERALKSIGHEETFSVDRQTHDELHREVVRLADAVSSRLRAQGTGARTISLKLKFSDFTLITRSHTTALPIATAQAIVEVVEPLLRGVPLHLGVRLLGVSVSNFAQAAEQLSFDQLLAHAGSAGAGNAERVSPIMSDWTSATGAIDAIRDRFGTTSIGPASAMSATGLRLARKGAQQWGPDHDKET
jgi:DNA polymerase-4